MEAITDITNKIIASVTTRFGERGRTDIDAPLARCIDIGSGKDSPAHGECTPGSELGLSPSAEEPDADTPCVTGDRRPGEWAAMGSGPRIGASRVTVTDKTRTPSLVYDRLDGTLIAIDRDGDIGKADAAAVKRQDSLALTVGHWPALFTRGPLYLSNSLRQQHELAIDASLRGVKTTPAQFPPVILANSWLPRVSVEAERNAVCHDHELIADVGQGGCGGVCHFGAWISATTGICAGTSHCAISDGQSGLCAEPVTV